jgi:hypothetical protein
MFKNRETDEMPLTTSFFVFPIDDDSRLARRSLAQGPSV